MKSGLNVMEINIKGIEELKRCADNILESVQQLEESVQEFNECKLTLDVYPKAEEKITTDKVEIYQIRSTPEGFKKRNGFVPSDFKLNIDVNIGECESTCNTPFGQEDLEDIISDLQEEYYRLGRGEVSIKTQIADLIDRLCRLREKWPME